MQRIRFVLFDWGGTLAKKGTRPNFIFGNRLQKQKVFFPDVVPTLDYLRKRGYGLGLVSNTDFTHDQMQQALQQSRVNDYFSCNVFSNGRNICKKPCLAIFNEAYRCIKRQKPNIKRNEVLFVGNNYLNDIYGAKQYGFQTAFALREASLPQTLVSKELKAHDLVLDQISDLILHL